MKNFKRLFKLIKPFKGLAIVSIIMIVFVQILGFIGPLIVKEVLDNCLLGIEQPWYEIKEETNNSVNYLGKNYIQEKHLDNQEIINDVYLVLIDHEYYLVNDPIVQGEMKIENNTLIINTKEGTIYTYEVINVPSSEIRLFYKPIIPTLILLLILLAVKSILSIIFSYIQQMTSNRVRYNIAKTGRTIATLAAERLPIVHFDDEPAGKMATRITNDVDGIINLYTLTFTVFLNAIFSFIFAYVGMFYLNPKLALLSLIIYPIAFIWMYIYLKFLKSTANKVNESRSLLNAKINEIINGIQILKIFNFKKRTVQEFNQINQDYMDYQLKEVRLHTLGGWNLINILKGVITTIIVWYFGLQQLNVYGVIITAGLIYAYNEYLLKVVDPIHILLTQIGTYQHSHVQMDRIFKIIESDLEDDSKELIPRYQGNIKFDNVWFAYHENDYVLKGVSFDIKAGQMIGLVGHTGSGKSSLMNLLLRFYDITDECSGNIYIDDIPINTYSKRTHREHIGIVLQEPVLFKGTIASNIRFGKENVTDEEIEKVIISMGGKSILDKLPNGINQEISISNSILSVGEKQIISLARAIILDPAILIMDEATSHIDTETETMIKKALEVVCKNRTVIVIAHRLSTIFNADKIIVLENGLKVEEGTHQTLMENNNVYANIYRSQVVK